MLCIHPSKITAVCVACFTLIGFRLPAQTLLWDDFDDYDAGDEIQFADGDDPADPGWDMWDLVGPTAYVSDEEYYSEPNSLRLQPASDVVQVFTGVSSGQWVARAMTYYSSDAVGDAFFILLNTYSHGGTKNWSTQVRFNTEGVASAGGSGFSRNARLPLILDRWVEIRVEIDLDSGMQQIFYGGELLDASHQWQQGGINELQCIDLYSESIDGFFYDDVAILEKCDIEVVAQPARGVAPLEVTLDASDWECSEGDLTAFEWEFGDGQSGTGPTVMHTYVDPGLYQARVTGLNEDGAPTTAAVNIGVGCAGGDVSPWTESEVGAPMPPGCATLAGSCVELVSGGPGLDRDGDSLRFVYREITGDFSAVARIREIDWAVLDKAGILARASLDPDSAYAFSAAWNRTTGLSARIERRDAPGKTPSGSTKSVNAAWDAPDLWLRLDREGETFTGYWSPDGQTWNEINDRTVSGATPAMLVGVAASPDAAASRIQATFCDISISQGPSADQDQDGLPDAGDNCPSVANADQADADGDGVGDVCDNCPAVANAEQTDADANGVGDVCESTGFRRGDVDGLGSVQLTDAIGLLNFLFGGGASPPACMEAADADDNGTLQLTDAVRILGFLFGGAEAPPAPGPTDCGPDPVGSPVLGCEEYTSC